MNGKISDRTDQKKNDFIKRKKWLCIINLKKWSGAEIVDKTKWPRYYLIKDKKGY